MAINVASLFLMLFLSQAGDLFFPKVSSALPGAANVPRVVDIINAGFRIGMAVAAVITVIEIWRGLRRLKRWNGAPLTPGSAHARAGR